MKTSAELSHSKQTLVMEAVYLKMTMERKLLFLWKKLDLVSKKPES